MVNRGLPPLFGAPWERQKPSETGVSSGEWFDGLEKKGMDWAERQLLILNPALLPEMAKSVTLAIAVMAHRGQSRVASDLFYLAQGHQ